MKYQEGPVLASLSSIADCCSYGTYTAFFFLLLPHTQTLSLPLSLSSESPFSEPGGEAEPDGGTETQTSEEGTL